MGATAPPIPARCYSRLGVKPSAMPEMMTFWTVSYTHLDVYKRQGYEFSLQPEFSDWLIGILVSCEKKLAAVDKEKVKQVPSAGVGA